MELQVLVAAMHQNDNALLQNMNIQSDVIVGNQCNRTECRRFSYRGYDVLWLSSTERGVGRNRNHTLLQATGEFCLFADEDVSYRDGYAQAIVRSFSEKPKADVIVFHMDRIRNGSVMPGKPHPGKRLHIWNAMRYGTCSIAIRRQRVLRAGITFSTQFGGGCPYGSGEDSLFLADCLRKGLRVYTSNWNLGSCTKDQSSWFTGYNEKYFYDKGAWLACAFPKLKHGLKWYMWFHYRNLTELSARDILCQLNRGIRGYVCGQTFEQGAKEETQ